jgi:dCMP deaminase
MQQAEAVSQWSRDPRRKVGCIIVDADNNQLSGGYNGFPRGIADDDRLLIRDTKNKLMVHAEANAVAAAARNGHSVKGATAYVTHNPCCQCACLLIQAGILRVVYAKQEGHSPDWTQDFEWALSLLQEACVEVTEFKEKT